jgi:uncharacterized protein (DUF1697 family)
MSRYVALLRGINVGGRNLIGMAELKTCFEAAGYVRVSTYIQSGNVIFTATAAAADDLAHRIEALLGATFDYGATVVLRTQEQMRAIVTRAPEGFGEEPDLYRYDVLFLKDPLAASAVLEGVPIREGVDAAHAGPGVIYFSRLASKAAQSRLSRLAAMPIYKSITARNWNTTTKLLRLMEEQDG